MEYLICYPLNGKVWKLTSNWWQICLEYHLRDESITLKISHVDASACVGGAIKDSALIYKFDIQQKEISQPQTNVAVNVPRRRNVQAICDKQGKMYVFKILQVIKNLYIIEWIF